MEEGLTRRAVIKGGGAVALAVFVAGDGTAFGVAPRADGKAAFLSEAELTTLRAAVDRFVPGKPEDADDGAVAAGCAEGIDALLGAFRTRPARIYAGGPFSDRGGAKRNDFARFVPLDPYETKAWRLRIEGSKGRKRLEFNGPVKGLQLIYREGLAALDATGFATASGAERDATLRESSDPAVRAFVDVAFPQTLQLIYGAPEYGGNRDRIGWAYTNYDGDVQPRGWTREEIEAPTAGDLGEVLPRGALAFAALSSAEVAQGILTRSDGSLSALEAEVGPAIAHVRRRGAGAG